MSETPPDLISFPPPDLDHDDSEDSEEDDDEIDAEAEEMARRLGAQLWEDIQASVASEAQHPPEPRPKSNAMVDATSANVDEADEIVPDAARKVQAIVSTINAILALVDKDSLALSSLSSTPVAGYEAQNVLQILKGIVSSGQVTKTLAASLSHSVISIAQSQVLFGNPRRPPAPSLDLGKRKREDEDDGSSFEEPRVLKRPYTAENDLRKGLHDAVQTVAAALSTLPPPAIPPDSAVISSIQMQLHQIFLFSVTSSPRPCGSADGSLLQELGGLIQVLGVLSHTPIGQNAPTDSSSPTTDIGTAVYPCTVSSCTKTFSKLYFLRMHQQQQHTDHRPFHCESCPASFVRAHDLKRHAQLHERRAWKCMGCQRIFSRRDALKRHKNNKAAASAGRENGGEEPMPVCLRAQVIEVEQPDSKAEDKRTNFWTVTAAAVTSAQTTAFTDPALASGIEEDGEVSAQVLAEIQADALSLKPLLQAHVSNALGTHSTPSDAPVLSPRQAQEMSAETGVGATLANVIARVQARQEQSADNMDLPANSSEGLQGDVSFDPFPPSSEQQGGAATITDATASLLPESLSSLGLSDEQARMLELAISNAALVAQAQAEAEAALEDEDEDEDEGEDDDSLAVDEDEPMNDN